MLTLDNVNGAEVRDTVACQHQRNKVAGLVESGQITLPCRSRSSLGGKGGDAARVRAAIAKAEADITAMSGARSLAR
jgi:hypothetical protein